MEIASDDERDVEIIRHPPFDPVCYAGSRGFRSIDGFVVPTQFAVRVVGSGPMFWLNIDAGETYSRFRFSSTPPVPAAMHQP